jgi:hypothetical protein
MADTPPPRQGSSETGDASGGERQQRRLGDGQHPRGIGGIDVDEGDPQPEEVRGRGRSAEREGRHEHLVTGHEPHRLVGSQQGRGAARRGDHMGHGVQ